MSDFDEYVIKPEKLVWENDIAVTTRGTYMILQKHHLSFTPPGGVIMKLGRFANPRKKAREHYNEEA